MDIVDKIHDKYLYLKQDLANTNSQIKLDERHLTDTSIVAQNSFLKRRERKSTSDETFSYELDLSKTSVLFTNSLIKNQDTDKLNLSYGKFGYNPINISPSAFGKIKSSKERRIKRLSNSISTDKKHNVKNKLILAVTNNDYHSVLDLLQTSHIDVNCFDDKQRTCLHIASSRGNVDIVRILLDFGSNPNIKDCVGNLPIHLAIISSHVPVVTLLLEAGTDIQSLDLQGKTVLHLAGTRLRWLINDDNHKASPKLKLEAIQIMKMIKEYLRRKQKSTNDIDLLSNKFENVFSFDDINSLTKELLDKFDTFSIKST